MINDTQKLIEEMEVRLERTEGMIKRGEMSE